MWKIIGGVIVGVFVGALALEILNRKRPELVKDIEKRAENAARSFVDAFREGYLDKRAKAKAE